MKALFTLLLALWIAVGTIASANEWTMLQAPIQVSHCCESNEMSCFQQSQGCEMEQCFCDLFSSQMQLYFPSSLQLNTFESPQWLSRLQTHFYSLNPSTKKRPPRFV